MQNITKIKPGGSWITLNLKELWTYRELFYFLTWRDVKIRYKQTAIGILWAILQPVLTTAIFTVIFSQLARVETSSVPYPLFALSGLLVWVYINNSITLSSNSLIGNANLVTKVYFPRLIVPISAALAGLIDFALGFVILISMMIYYGVALTPQIFLLPFFLLLIIILTLSCGTLFSAVNVRFRDVKFALPFALQIWMFLSTIFYPLDILPEKWRAFFAFNPLIGILQGFRASLFGERFDWTAIGASIVITFLIMLFSLFVFKQMEDDFADLI